MIGLTYIQVYGFPLIRAPFQHLSPKIDKILNYQKIIKSIRDVLVNILKYF